jgi:hypothetical protein
MLVILYYLGRFYIITLLERFNKFIFKEQIILKENKEFLRIFRKFQNELMIQQTCVEAATILQ